MDDETLIVHAGRRPQEHHGAVNTPVYHASTILWPSVAALEASFERRQRDEQGVYYGRLGTPTSQSLEEAVAALEGGYRALTYPSGLGAITSALLAFAGAGDHVLITDSVYGPTRNFADGMLKRLGVAVEYYDPLAGGGIAGQMRPETRVVFVESPGSLTFEMQDIPAIAEAAHAAGAVVLMDNTWSAGLYFKPFAHGVDVSVQAGTKYIVGHSDAMLGTATATRECWPRLQQATQLLGTTAGPDDQYLANRGLRTMAVRLARHQDSALTIADWLRSRPEVREVLYPALPGAAGHDLWKRDFTGASGLFAIELQPGMEAKTAPFIDSLELFGIGYSWGGFESLAIPAKPEKSRTVTPWRDRGPLVRLHIGLEAPDDLMADLAAAFKAIS